MMLKFIIVSVLLNITCRNFFINCAEQKNVADTGEKKPESAPVGNAIVHVNLPDGKVEQPRKPPKEEDDPKTKGNIITVVHKDKNNSNSTTLAPIPIRANPKNDLLQSGALLRGFYVFLGLSVITVFYFVYRSYRLRHGSQPSTTVKKYGITARRSDMEMRPLELDDEDDDTLFEVNTSTTNR